MFLDQPVFILLPLVIFYYILPIYMGHYLGRSEKSPLNLLLPVSVIGLFYLLRPFEINAGAYLKYIILPALVLLFAGYAFGILKRKVTRNSTIPYIIGVTGLPCSGKSEAARILGKLGAKVIDVDRLGHTCMENKETISQLTAAFGTEILTPQGTVDRKKLGALVFGSGTGNRLQQLEMILHPAMIAKIEEEIKFLEPEAILILDAAILHHMKLDKICRKVLVTYTDQQIRLERAEKRGWDEAELQKRDTAVRKSLKFNNITLIINNNSIDHFKENIENIWKEIIHER